MDKKKIIIYSLTTSFFLIAISPFIYLSISAHNQDNLSSRNASDQEIKETVNHQKNGSAKKIDSDKNNSEDQKKITVQKQSNNEVEDEQLVNYFWVILISFFTVYFIFFYICFLYLFKFLNDKNNKMDEACYYLKFIKFVLEMFSYEICLKKKNNSYQKKLDFPKENFLETFILNQEKNKKHDSRKHAHNIIFMFRRRILYFFSLQSVLLVLSYLSSFVINLIINFCFQGKKTWQRLKFSSIWMMFFKLKKYQKNIFLFYCLFLVIIFLLFLFFLNNKFQNPSLFYLFLTMFFNLYKQEIQQFKDIPSFKLTNKHSGIYIWNINLNEKYFKGFNEDIGELKKCFPTNALMDFLNQIKNCLDNDSEFEKNVFNQIQEFIKELEK